MKQGSLLINTARGALIDHPALLQALNSEVISGFAADVLPDEPPVESVDIVRHPRAIITPHTGYVLPRPPTGRYARFTINI